MSRPVVELSAIPEPEPAACIRHAWRSLLDNPAVLIVVALAIAFVNLVGDGLLGSGGLGSLAGLAILLLLFRPLQWAFAYVCLRSVRGDDVEANDLLVAFDRYREIVTAHVLIAGMVVLGSLLIVPGILFYARTRFAPYLIIEEKLSATEAIRESFRLTEGYTGTILAIVALGCLAVSVGSIPFGLGIVPALVWWDLTLASLYHAAVLPDERAPVLDEAAVGAEGV